MADIDGDGNYRLLIADSTLQTTAKTESPGLLRIYDGADYAKLSVIVSASQFRRIAGFVAAAFVRADCSGNFLA